MLIAAATLERVVFGFLLACACVALHTGCGSSDGGGGGSNAGSGPVPEAGAEAGAAGDDSGGAVKWCDAYRIINCSCQQCHQAEPLHGAPIPLMTYDDTQAPFPTATSENRVWQTMESVVRTGFMPFTGDESVMPPVEPLSQQDMATLLKWIEEGATDEGGRNCREHCTWPDTAR